MNEESQLQKYQEELDYLDYLDQKYVQENINLLNRFIEHLNLSIELCQLGINIRSHVKDFNEKYNKSIKFQEDADNIEKMISGCEESIKNIRLQIQEQQKIIDNPRFKIQAKLIK